MDIKLGFIGTGNMGTAIIKSIVKSGVIPAGEIYIYDIDKERLDKLAGETGAKIVKSEGEIVEKSDIIILAVKPNTVKTALESCIDRFDSKKILVSIAVGLSISYYKKIIGKI